MKSKLICLAACFAILFAPLFLGISLDGKAHAMGLFGGGGGNNDSSPSPSVSISEPPAAPVSHAPEPATLVLFGAGAVGLAALRKKFKKK